MYRLLVSVPGTYNLFQLTVLSSPGESDLPGRERYEAQGKHQLSVWYLTTYLICCSIAPMKMNSNSEENHDDIRTQPLADVYAFLALTMRYPDASFITEDFLDVFENLLVSFNMAAEQEEIRACRQQGSNFVDTLQIEYTRLFINAVPHIVAPPYGSFYLDGDYTLQGKSSRKTRDFYRQYGYDISDTSEPADHIRLELEFLAALTREGELEAEEQFLKTIFRPWFSRFQKRVLDEKGHPYYMVSTKLIDFFTKEEQ